MIAEKGDHLGALEGWMNWKNIIKAEYDTKPAAGKEQEFVVWKHRKYHKVMEATMETKKIHVL